MRRPALMLLTAWLLAACGASELELRTPVTPARGTAEQFGAGFASKRAPAELAIATNRQNKSVTPKVTPDFSGVPRSNSWWSSLIWQFDETNPYSLNLYAHPLVMRATQAGLGLGYPSTPELKPREYMYRYAQDLTLGLEGQAFPDTRVAGYSDFAVTAVWKTDKAELRATFGHGLPYVYATRTGSARALIGIARGTLMDVVKEDGNALLLKLGTHFYGVFAPSKSRWEKTEAGFASDLAGQDYFSVALLPDDRSATFELFRSHAYAFVTDTKVSWAYDEATAELVTSYRATTSLKETGSGLLNSTLLALYRHQYLHTQDPLSQLSYNSPRGRMKLRVGSEFTTRSKFHGVLPVLPNAAGLPLSSLSGELSEAYAVDDLFPKGYGPGKERDAYWAGKSLGRNTNTLYIADQLGQKEAKQRLVTAIENELSDWFDGTAPRLLHYDKRWRSLIALPASYGSAEQLNDHHFHYGYFVGAAAAIARFDPAWARRYAPMIEQLIKDAANPDREDTRFPFMRHMDLYAGHSWANGPAQFDDGNNQEASSEDLNLSASIVLWGSQTGDTKLRDLGIFLHTQQVLAAEQYWFDVDGQVFPEGFEHSVVGMVWSAGAKYDTWFDQDPIMVHGINYLPFTGASTYLGRSPEYVKKNFEEVWQRSSGAVYSWRDYLLMYLALAEPERALKLFEEDTHFTPEFGNTKLMLRHWLSSLQALGSVAPGISADIATYGVFKGPKGTSHVAFNPEAKPRLVRFSDGATLSVGPRSLGVKVSK